MHISHIIIKTRWLVTNMDRRTVFNVLLLIATASLVSVTILKTIPVHVGQQHTVPLTKTASGVYTASVGVATHNDGFEVVHCVVDTGSSHLCVGGVAVGGTRKSGPQQIHYGTQVDDVNWSTVDVRVGGTVHTVTLASTNRRRCSSPVCFNVMGLAYRGNTGSFPPPPVPLLQQLQGVHTRFSLTLGHHGGTLVFDPPRRRICLFRSLPGNHTWYLVELRDMFVREHGGGTVAISTNVPNKLMVDSGSNMLGVSPGVAVGLRRVLGSQGRGDLVLRIGDARGSVFDYVVPESVYRHTDGTLLLDDHGARHDIVVLGSLFMVGHTFVFDTGSVGIRT